MGPQVNLASGLEPGGAGCGHMGAAVAEVLRCRYVLEALGTSDFKGEAMRGSSPCAYPVRVACTTQLL